MAVAFKCPDIELCLRLHNTKWAHNAQQVPLYKVSLTLLFTLIHIYPLCLFIHNTLQGKSYFIIYTYIYPLCLFLHNTLQVLLYYSHLYIYLLCAYLYTTLYKVSLTLLFTLIHIYLLCLFVHNTLQVFIIYTYTYIFFVPVYTQHFTR